MARRWISRIVIGVAAAAIAGAAPYLWSQARSSSMFRVTAVEVRGARYLAPADVVRESGLNHRASILESPATWTGNLRRHPLIVDVSAGRKLPGTLVLTVTEAEPVALVAVGGSLRPVDAMGREQPLDPRRIEGSLPVVVASATDSGQEVGVGVATAVAAYADLLATDPTFASRVSEIVPVPDGAELVFSDASLRIVLPVGAGAAELGRLDVALAQLGERRTSVERVDLRFRGQAVISFVAEGHR